MAHLAMNGTWRKVVGTALVVALTASLGACNRVSKTQYEAAVGEANELRQRQESLETSLRERDSRIADLENQNRDLQTRAATPAAPQGGADWGVPPGGGGGSQGGPRGDVVIEVKGDVLFDSGQATIKSTARRELDQIAARIQRQYPSNMIRLEGHTDSDPIRRSRWGTNEALSQARAEAVMNYLAQRGVSASRMEAVGMGSSRPKGTKAASRRVEIIILGGR
jgi:outer membrane protein OmpA-like peptidoglycan-associated protein